MPIHFSNNNRYTHANIPYQDLYDTVEMHNTGNISGDTPFYQNISDTPVAPTRPGRNSLDVNDAGGYWSGGAMYYNGIDNGAFDNTPTMSGPGFMTNNQHHLATCNDAGDHAGSDNDIPRVASPESFVHGEAPPTAGNRHKKNPIAASPSKSNKKSNKRKKGSTDSTQSTDVHQGSDPEFDSKDQYRRKSREKKSKLQDMNSNDVVEVDEDEPWNGLVIGADHKRRERIERDISNMSHWSTL
ncbi:hypothetical protein PG997_009750 [Apiospora hydei]|uniref:Uncharacterized protein n=1 Tax=Apiospora hydei TaxID=1337664 RepID=A0ABR1VV72_9PEZI